MKVSVIVPVYNVESYLRGCLDSLLKQTLTDLELICVDDGSTDGSGAILDEYALREVRMQVIHQPNAGAGAARNAGLDRARGEYLYFCDPDDWCDREMLEAMCRRADETGADVVACERVCIESATGKTAYERRFPECAVTRPAAAPAEIAADLFILDPHVPWDKVFRRSFVVGLGLRYQELPRSNDVFFVDMALALARRIAFLPRTFYHHRLRRQGSLQTTKDATPMALYEAYDALRAGLERHGVLTTFALSYARALVNSACFHLRSMLDPENRRRSLKELNRRIRALTEDGPVEKSSFLATWEGGRWQALNRVVVDFVDVRPGELVVSGHHDVPDCLSPVTVTERHSLDGAGETSVERVDGEPWGAVVHGLFSPFSERARSVYCLENGWLLRSDGERLRVCRSTWRAHLRAELRYCRELLTKGSRPALKALALHCLVGVLRPFIRRPIWILSDRESRADDNARALFEYACARPDRARGPRCVFAIDASSPDWPDLRKTGRVVDMEGKLYKLLFLLSDFIVSAYHTRTQRLPFSDDFVAYAKRDVLRPQFVYLRHGVGEKDLSLVCNRRINNARLMMTTAAGERRSVLDGDCGYVEGNVRLCGMPRYDRLYDDRRRIVTVMPTWRRGLIVWDEHGRHRPAAAAAASDFVRAYHALLTDGALLDACARKGYALQLMIHPNLVSLLPMLAVDSRVKVLPQTESYRKVFAESDLLVTDYSSTAFDFAYLRKPVVYFQFDYAEYFGVFYRPGFFDYGRDGFGPVERTVRATVDRVVEILSSGCAMPEVYRRRAEAFFAYSDRENCRRVYEAIAAERSGCA